jgi:hypothetical protein
MSTTTASRAHSACDSSSSPLLQGHGLASAAGLFYPSSPNQQQSSHRALMVAAPPTNALPSSPGQALHCTTTHPPARLAVDSVPMMSPTSRTHRRRYVEHR